MKITSFLSKKKVTNVTCHILSPLIIVTPQIVTPQKVTFTRIVTSFLPHKNVTNVTCHILSPVIIVTPQKVTFTRIVISFLPHKKCDKCDMSHTVPTRNSHTSSSHLPK